MSIATNILDCAARPAPNTAGKTTTSCQNAVGVCSKTPRVYTDVNTYGRGRTERPPNRAAWVTQPRRRQRGRSAWRMRGAGQARKKTVPICLCPLPKTTFQPFLRCCMIRTYGAYEYGNAAPRVRIKLLQPNRYSAVYWTYICLRQRSTPSAHRICCSSVPRRPEGVAGWRARNLLLISPATAE